MKKIEAIIRKTKFEDARLHHARRGACAVLSHCACRHFVFRPQD